MVVFMAFCFQARIFPLRGYFLEYSRLKGKILLWVRQTLFEQAFSAAAAAREREVTT